MNLSSILGVSIGLTFRRRPMGQIHYAVVTVSELLIISPSTGVLANLPLLDIVVSTGLTSACLPLIGIVVSMGLTGGVPSTVFQPLLVQCGYYITLILVRLANRLSV